MDMWQDKITKNFDKKYEKVEKKWRIKKILENNFETFLNCEMEKNWTILEENFEENNWKI